MAFTFQGGLHLKDNKGSTKDKPITGSSAPKKVTIPLCQHTGALCDPLVSVGDLVKKGQRIGDTEKYISAPVHASISGKVTAIEPRIICGGSQVMSIIIESDGKDALHDSIKPIAHPKDLGKKEIRSIVRSAGIVGLGGAAFPTHVKLSPPDDKKIDHIILNGAECEPYITCDHRIMLERSQDVLFGLKIIMRATDAKTGLIAIESNKPDAIKIFNALTVQEPNIKVAVVKAKYPQGGEKQLIKAVTGREVPTGGLPLDAGVIVNNVGTAAAISDSINKGLPLINKIITVTGDAIKDPSNINVRIGTSIEEVINCCGGLIKEPKKTIIGGPMMGMAQFSLDIPITKHMNCILVLSKEKVKTFEEGNCIRCAKCVDICPSYLHPNRLTEFAKNGKFEATRNIGALDCMECGLCSYVCPAKIELVHYIKLAKFNLNKKKEAAKK